MAIVKANYVKRGREAKTKAKATISYIQSRPNKEKKASLRELFGSDGPLTREQVERMIDEAGKGTLFYRLVISPDPHNEELPKDIDLRELTIETMARLEERLKTKILYAAVEHTDHSPHRHVHVLALLNRKLSNKDLLFLRKSATAAVLLQRQIRDLSLDRALGREPARVGENALDDSKPQAQYAIQANPLSSGSAPPIPRAPSCPSCNEGQGTRMHRIAPILYRCPHCFLIFRDAGMGLQIEEQRPSLELSI